MYYNLKRLHLTDKQILELKKLFEEANQHSFPDIDNEEKEFCKWINKQIYNKESRYVPKVRRGSNSDCYPMYFIHSHEDYFETREECDKWIQDHQDDFSANEISGGVYTEEILI